MKAILRFDLDDLDDRMAHLRCTKALDLAIAINDIYDLCRRWRDNPPTGCSHDAIDIICDKIHQTIEIDISEMLR